MALMDRFRKAPDIDFTKLPVHVAIIPDGNGRWATKRGMPRSIGHREGANAFKKIVRLANEIGIGYLTFYAFSTENWTRPEKEVHSLMSLLFEFLQNADKELEGSNIKIRVIGDTSRLTSELQEEIKRVLKNTHNNTGLSLVFALNYGGRDELINAVRKIIKDVENGSLSKDDIGEESLRDRLYTQGIPDPELLIRTSGELRLSNFMLWQSAYTEFWYSQKLWPDFKKDDFLEAIRVYQKRKRRFGGI